MFRRMTTVLSMALLGLMLQSPAFAGEAEDAEAAFQKFATSWVADMERQAKKDRSGARRYTSYEAAAVETKLKPTGNAAAPFVGTLTYVEHVYECQSAQQKSCEKVGSAPVTEIFPFQGGRWRY